MSSFFYMFFLAGIMIPIRLGILPLFLLMRDLNLLNTHWSLILTYAASGMPMSVFLLTGFFRTIPKDLEYSARIDGCSELQIFYRIMLPLVRPGLATVTIVNFVPWWNDFFFPLLFIQSDHLKTIPLGMTIFFGQFMTDWDALCRYGHSQRTPVGAIPGHVPPVYLRPYRRCPERLIKSDMMFGIMFDLFVCVDFLQGS